MIGIAGWSGTIPARVGLESVIVGSCVRKRTMQLAIEGPRESLALRTIGPLRRNLESIPNKRWMVEKEGGHGTHAIEIDK